VFTDGFPQLEDTQAVRIVRESILYSLDRTLADDLRRGEIRLSNFEMNNMLPLSFKFMGPFQYIHHDK